MTYDAGPTTYEEAVAAHKARQARYAAAAVGAQLTMQDQFKAHSRFWEEEQRKLRAAEREKADREARILKARADAATLAASHAMLRANSPWPSIRRIILFTTKVFDVSVADIISHRRKKIYVKPRQAAMYVCKQLTLRSLGEIGRSFDGRDHTTVIHAVWKIEELLKTDADLAEKIARIKVLVTTTPANADAA